MKLIFVANSLTDPTRETLEEVSKKTFKKLVRLLDDEGKEAELRISAEKEGSEFTVSVDVRTFKNGSYFTKATDFDLRKAINECSSELKTIIRREKDKLKEIK